MTLLLIACCCAVGAGLRWWMTRYHASLPWGTLLVNLIGCFAIGTCFILIQGLIYKLLVTGFLGGLTTFSTLHFEITDLWHKGQKQQALLHLALNYLLGGCCFMLGIYLASLI